MMTKTDKPKLTNGNLIRPNPNLQDRIDAYHENFERTHNVEVKRAQILLSLISAGLDYHERE